MAHLPPKIPTNWPSFPHQRTPSMNSFLQTSQPLWVEEFLDFSSAKRGSHRRSASDSIAFLEAPLVEECRSSTSKPKHDFDRLDEEQLMSMFSDDISPSVVPPQASPNSSENPSTPSDQDSVNDPSTAIAEDNNHDHTNTTTTNNNTNKNNDGKSTSEKKLAGDHEVQSPCNSDARVTTTTTTRSNGSYTVSGDSSIDPKRVKRILANRQSAQRSRVRKLQYISELERSVSSLQTEVSALSPRVAFLDHQRLVLNVDNSALKQRIAALAQDKLFKDAHQEALKDEIERLRQVYHQQNLKNKINGSQEETLETKEHCCKY